MMRLKKIDPFYPLLIGFFFIILFIYNRNSFYKLNDNLVIFDESRYLSAINSFEEESDENCLQELIRKVGIPFIICVHSEDQDRYPKVV